MTDETTLKTANPAPLGLIAFGMTTLLLNLHNANVIDMSVMIIAMGIAVGGFAQFIAGLFSFRAGNTFNATAFTSYGVFWWSLVIALVNPHVLGMAEADGSSMGWFFLCWGVYTAFMFVGTLKANHAVQAVFLTLAILLLLLAANSFSGNDVVGFLAGIDGIICGASAMYTAVATVVNEQFDRSALPV